MERERDLRDLRDRREIPELLVPRGPMLRPGQTSYAHQAEHLILSFTPKTRTLIPTHAAFSLSRSLSLSFSSLSRNSLGPSPIPQSNTPQDPRPKAPKPKDVHQRLRSSKETTNPATR